MVTWVRNIVIGLAALGLAGMAAAAVLSNAAVRINPSFAVKANPLNGTSLDRKVGIQIPLAIEAEAEGKEFDYGNAVGEARHALRLEPVSLDSLALLTLAERAKGRTDLSNRLLDHAATLSRRDLVIQSLLIERAGKREDLGELLTQIDTTLRSKQALYPTLFPALAQSMHEPELYDELVRLAREDPRWYHFFIGHAVTVPSALPTVRRLMMEAPTGSAARDRSLRINLMSQLIANDEFGLAQSYFRSLHEDARNAVVDPSFEHPEFEQPFGWTLSDRLDLGSDLLKDEGLSAFADEGREGIVAWQMVGLSRGRHVFKLETDESGLHDSYLQLVCTNGREVALRHSVSEGRFEFNVPSDCPTQQLRVGLRDNDDSRPIDVVIRSVREVRAGSER